MTRRDWIASLLVSGATRLGDERDQCHCDIALPEPIWVQHLITFYCPCDICCGTWHDGELVTPARGITSRGHAPIEGCTVAVDPTVWPYGSLIDIERFGVRLASDCGQKVQGLHLDVFVDSHKKAIQLGRRHLKARKFNG